MCAHTFGLCICVRVCKTEDDKNKKKKTKYNGKLKRKEKKKKNTRAIVHQRPTIARCDQRRTRPTWVNAPSSFHVCANEPVCLESASVCIYATLHLIGISRLIKSITGLRFRRCRRRHSSFSTWSTTMEIRREREYQNVKLSKLIHFFLLLLH